MCGIAGYINIDMKPVQDTSTVLSMLQVQKHRGPDDSGIRAFSILSGDSIELNNQRPCIINGHYEGILGFNRLSILDLSLNGHQPMISPDGKVILALNGEIYNAFDFKKELIECGYIFKSNTDTEVVLALYLKYGFEGMLSRLNGMFAIVIVDLIAGLIFIARDRFGIKPMYYIYNGVTFAFSSELKSFRYIENFNFQLAEEQLDEYLLFRNNLSGTLFKEIQSLTPGFYLTFSNKNGLTGKRFFDINNYSRSVSLTGTLSSYTSKLEECLSKSVSSQLMSDVKLGCQLSGGIDSSLVTWLANMNSNKGSFEAVSIIFNNSSFSEEGYIDTVTKKLGIESHRFLLDSDYYFDHLEEATWHLESPINHPNTIAIYKLSQQAKEYVTVLLSGEGADEVFGGYERFYEISYPYRVRLLLHEIKKHIRRPLNAAQYFDHELRAVMANAYMTPIMAEKLKGNFMSKNAIESRKSLYRSLSGSLLDRQIKYEILSYLPDLLIRQDKMSMAHSIENRVPFLDNDVVENSFTIPAGYLLVKKSPEGFNNEKYLLKKITAGIFGDSFAFRNKMGFGIPVKEFFLNKKFTEYMNDNILPCIRQRGLFNSKLVSSWLSNINALKYYEVEALWVIVTFEIWASIYLDNNNENSHSLH
jgi:asparagine synthase (glutamine-hydrolysing)